MSEEKNAPPEKTIRAGGVVASIWKNKSKDGKEFKTIGIERTYKDGDEFKKTSSYNLNDLPKLALVTKKAYEYLVTKEEVVE